MLREFMLKGFLFIWLLLVWNCEDTNPADNEIFDFGVVINEINYHSLESFNPGDWVEIYNKSNEIKDLSRWQLKDDNEDHIYSLPLNTILLPDQFIVLCKDTIKFKENFSDVENIYGNFDFGFGSNNDIVRLFDSTGSLIDIVEYSDDLPWPITADGDGPTLELKNPNLDNNLWQSWSSSDQYGTPGNVNSVYTSGED